MRFLLKVRPAGMVFLMWSIFAVLLVNTLASYGFFNLSGVGLVLLPTIGGLFLLVDQGVISMKRGLGKPASGLGWVLSAVGTIILLGVIVSVTGFSLGNSMSSVVSFVNSIATLALLVSLVTE